jgi:hypothetical protein
MVLGKNYSVLKIENLHANVGDKPILKGLSLALGLTFATLSASARADDAAKHPMLETKVASGSVSIPDEIAPAVVPYLMCLNKAINEGVGNGAEAEQMRDIEAQALQLCRTTREAAAAKADNLLQLHDKTMKSPARATKVESTLVSIEAMFTDMAEKMEQMNATETKTEMTNAPNN